MSSEFEWFVEDLSHEVESFRRVDGILRLDVEPERFSVKLEFVELSMTVSSLALDILEDLKYRLHEVIDVEIAWHSERQLRYAITREYEFEAAIPQLARKYAQSSQAHGITFYNVDSTKKPVVLNCSAWPNFGPESVIRSDRHYKKGLEFYAGVLTRFCGEYLAATSESMSPMFANIANSPVGHA